MERVRKLLDVGLAVIVHERNAHPAFVLNPERFREAGRAAISMAHENGTLRKGVRRLRRWTSFDAKENVWYPMGRRIRVIDPENAYSRYGREPPERQGGEGTLVMPDGLHPASHLPPPTVVLGRLKLHFV